MGREIDSIEDLTKHATGRSVEEIILMDYVAPVVEEILRQHINRDIYNAYKPKRYSRRESLTSNIVSKMIAPDELLVTSVAQPNRPASGWVSAGDGAFLYMLQVGNMGWWRDGFPRPAISRAQRETDRSSKVSAAKKAGLRHALH